MQKKIENFVWSTDSFSRKTSNAEDEGEKKYVEKQRSDVWTENQIQCINNIIKHIKYKTINYNKGG